jgi:hypothetical protein
VPWERVAEQNEMLDTGEVLVCFGDGRCVCLVEPIGTVRRNMRRKLRERRKKVVPLHLHLYIWYTQACLTADDSNDI